MVPKPFSTVVEPWLSVVGPEKLAEGVCEYTPAMKGIGLLSHARYGEDSRKKGQEIGRTWRGKVSKNVHRSIPGRPISGTTFWGHQR